MDSQLRSFIYGLQTRTPLQTIELWILGLQNRSGAVQYAVLSPALQKRTQKQFVENNWITGQSSPWVSNIHIVHVNKISETTQQFTLAYDLITSYASFGKGHKVITVEKNPEPGRENWFITKISTTFLLNEAITPAEMINQ
ncbi:hypothetical protein CSV71_13790 [Sporosarcina sp. P21c]|uniref:hypothetical protein n=1 Tax=Sporosarcina TaxID=1569 RepID=UPI000A1695A9|nr:MULTISPECIES: hypothetical protein [Sporosarcina]ARJ37676.1 hypothetical protein SporoP8_01535 [Sporosarcina ureae]PIC66123.1 hypothetical protein CSV78_14265 [Sporosarcina sp. P16a]PIC88654.1 hypothetical protein CSV71_13790 [Sporosarcina sp. P21c]PIC91725.1 hypothetical protein CSV70_14245 [Sporosarcina sp. P25]